MRSFVSLEERLRHAIKTRKVLLFVRQSGEQQAQFNLGSLNFQKEQLQRFAEYGLDPLGPRVEKVIAAESSREHAYRPQFERVCQLLDTGEYGLLVVAWENRVGRNSRDNARALELLKRHGVLLVARNTIYDPRDPTSKFQLQMQLSIAAWENDTRTVDLAETRFQKAREGRLMTKLPAGLVWACPAQVRHHYEDVDLADWVAESQVQRHQVSVRKADGTYIILPFPDPDVLRSMELRLAWLLETERLWTVLEMIREAEGDWPDQHKGLVPVTHSYRYRWNLQFRWMPALDSRLRRWFQSPALYGRYTFKSKVLAHPLDPQVPQVLKKNAFPALADDSTYAEVLRILGKRSPMFQGRGYRGPRSHGLSMVLCAADHEGHRCGRKLSVNYHPSGRYRYRCMACEMERGHLTAVLPSVEDTVLELVAHAFGPDALQDLLDEVTIQTGDITARVRALKQELETHEADMRWLPDAERKARRAGHVKRGERYAADFDKAEAQVADLMNQLAVLKQEEDELRALAQEDVDQILKLASDVRKLAAECRDTDRALQEAFANGLVSESTATRHEGRLRSLLALFVEAVHVERLADSFFRVEVEFIGGGRVSDTAFTGYFKCAQAARVFLTMRVKLGGLPPSDAADEINRLTAPLDPKVSWTEGRVKAAVLLGDHHDQPVPELKEPLTIRQVSEQFSLSERDVWAAALLGRLGDASSTAEGTLLVSPNRTQLHRSFPELARKDVAARAGWSVEETILLRDVKHDLGLEWHTIERAATYADGIEKDAAGRRYIRPARMVQTDEDRLEWALKQAPDHLRALDDSHWVRMAEACRRLGRVASTTVKKETVWFTCKGKNADHLWTYVWLPPAKQRELERLTLAEAVVRLSDDYGYPFDPEDFVLRTRALAALRSRIGFSKALNPWLKAKEEGRLLEVRALPPSGRGPRRYYVWFPEHCQSSKRAMRTWLGGECLPASERT